MEEDPRPAVMVCMWEVGDLEEDLQGEDVLSLMVVTPSRDWTGAARQYVDDLNL